MSQYYPLFMDIEKKPVLVVGGGTVAWRKVETLLEYGAFVRIVSPKLIPELEALIDNANCIWVRKEYETRDLEEAVLVFSCTEKETVNAQVAADAKALLRPVNVVDDPEKCSFIVPSIMRKGDLCVAVSTGGSSPILARQIRAELEEFYGDEFVEYLALLKSWRSKVKQFLPPERRQEFWLVATGKELKTLVKAKRLNDVEGMIKECFQSLQKE